MPTGVCLEDEPIIIAYRDDTTAPVGDPVDQLWPSCSEIKLTEGATKSGIYPILTGTGSIANAYCDMTMQGKHPFAWHVSMMCDLAFVDGGWTLFATKVSPGFQFTSPEADFSSLAVPDQDMAGAIPDHAMYTEVSSQPATATPGFFDPLFRSCFGLPDWTLTMLSTGAHPLSTSICLCTVPLLQ